MSVQATIRINVVVQDPSEMQKQQRPDWPVCRLCGVCFGNLCVSFLTPIREYGIAMTVVVQFLRLLCLNVAAFLVFRFLW